LTSTKRPFATAASKRNARSTGSAPSNNKFSD
jgi:hypothetical protein